MKHTEPTAPKSSWLRRVFNSFQQKNIQSRVVDHSVNLVVDTADSKIRLVSGYRRQLEPALIMAMEYSRRLVSQIPGPIRIDRSRYSQDALLRAIFPSSKQLSDFLKTSMANLAQPVTATATGEIVALLTMSQRRKTIYGHQQQGELTLRDVPMEAVTFYDHLLVAPSTSLAATLAQLEERALELLATVAMETIHGLQEELALLREERSHLASMRNILQGKNRAFSHFAPPSHTTRRKIEAISTAMVEKEEEIAAARREIGEPADALRHLVRILSNPESALIMEQLSLDLNWMNVVMDRLDSRQQGESNRISLARFSLNRELERQGILVCFPAEEAISP
ncbi:hypothetical protein [Desulfogranum mediterraneum]|uniref:hypothetical protein n=1 Tax=Desulfogranum mediterraneum TaxID=160661 RepID=UPI000401EF04|nr:hypothetical protein [Desulfogranum mediterraneum]